MYLDDRPCWTSLCTVHLTLKVWELSPLSSPTCLFSVGQCWLDSGPIPTAAAGQMTGMCSSPPLNGLSIGQLSLWADGMFCSRGRSWQASNGCKIQYISPQMGWDALPGLVQEVLITDRAENQVYKISQFTREFSYSQGKWVQRLLLL